MQRFFQKIKRAVVGFDDSGRKFMPKTLLSHDLVSAAGVVVTPEKALSLPAVLCAVATVSETLSMLPLLVYERAGENKRRAREHPVYKLLCRQPNRYQTAMEFESALQAQVLLFGNRDEVRALENLDSLPNGAGKEFLAPLNMAVVGSEAKALDAGAG